MIEEQIKDEPAKPKRWMLLVPLVVALLIGAFLFNGLSLNPREIPSALIGTPAPKFDLPAITDRPPGLKTADLEGQVSLVNVFASWCVACRVEHPILMDIQAEGDVPLHGLNYKDKPKAALAWLTRFGDPYGRVGADEKGRVGIDFGVYGVPETFLIDQKGQIVCKHIGPIDRQRDWLEKLKPAVAALRAGKAPKC
jgi:cytochrome c biogenesis protein CcmG/thiol:disulfide interchange protein DsbE